MKNNNTGNNAFKRLFSLMKPYRIRVILAIVLILLSVVCYSLAPYFLGQAIDGLGFILQYDGPVNTKMVEQAIETDVWTEETAQVAEQGVNFLLFLLLMLGAYLLHAVFSYLSNCLFISATENVIYDLRDGISKKLARLPLNYYDTHTYGDVLSRVTNDVDTVSASLQQAVSQILKAIFTVFILLYMMLSINGILTLVGLIVIPVALFIASKITAVSQKHFEKQLQKTGELNGYVEEYYSGQNVVAVCGREDTVCEKFDETNEELYDASRRGMYLADALTPIIQNTTNLGYTFVCFAGAVMSIAGGLSIGTIQAFTQYLTQFSSSVSEALSITGMIQSTRAAAARIFEFMDEEEEVSETEQPAFPVKLKGKVEFDHVRFGYMPHQTLIHDLNVTVNPGEKTAIVGPTGAGKTTLINLIMRFYDVKGGAIRIDGVDIRDMKREDLRNIFGMVLQETWLYAGTIRENIRYGKLDATDAEVEKAAKMARADAFIRTLPGGYDFVLQEGAGNIAQGQRQLLTIARAMLNDPPIMILDEATSSVDTRTEVLIQEAMSEMMKGHTSFVIAHRLSTIRDAQKILYMQDGDILEVGTHDELMAKDGLYAKLYNSQFAENNG